jgi:hypothetical protein
MLGRDLQLMEGRVELSRMKEGRIGEGLTGGLSSVTISEEGLRIAAAGGQHGRWAGGAKAASKVLVPVYRPPQV